MNGIITQYECSQAPGRLLLFPRGTFKHPEYGKMVFDDEFFDEIETNFRNKVLGQTEPFIDIDHDHGEAAGWIKGLSREPDGLYASVDWTDLGREKVASGRYRFHSPWWGQYKDPASGKVYDRVLRGGGLTNVPFLKVLPAVELFEPGKDSPARRRAHRGGAIFMLSELVPQSTNGAEAPRRRAAMAGLVRKLRETLGVREGSSLADLRGAFDRALMDGMGDMTPEEIAEMERRRKEEEATRIKDQEDSAQMKELRQLLGLNDNAGLAAMVGAMRALRGPSATLAERVEGSDRKMTELLLEVKKLSDIVAELKPHAEEAKKLREEATAREKQHYFNEQVRAGKVPPAERAFFEEMWDKNREATEKFLKDRKPVVKLHEIGHDQPVLVDDDKDPRVELSDLAEKRVSEKKIAYTQALAEVKAEHPDLVERIAGMVGPAGVR